jgi:hypothetical protein
MKLRPPIPSYTPQHAGWHVSPAWQHAGTLTEPACCPRMCARARPLLPGQLSEPCCRMQGENREERGNGFPQSVATGFPRGCSARPGAGRSFRQFRLLCLPCSMHPCKCILLSLTRQAPSVSKYALLTVEFAARHALTRSGEGQHAAGHA